MDDETLSWLCEDKNPAIKYRVQTELLRETADVSQSRDWIFSKLPKDWQNTKGMWYGYYVTALALCGLSGDDIPPEYLERAFDFLKEGFNCGCSDFMLLTSLIKMGFGENEAVKAVIESLNESTLPDGGFLCLNRRARFKYIPKSCYKANVFALMFVAQCKKRGIEVKIRQGIIDYFLNRELLYKSTDRTALVLPGDENGRSVDTFFPFEPMRVGVQNIIEPLCALGYGKDERLSRAWERLDRLTDERGRVILTGTLTKSYLPKEKVGEPSKWATFYRLLAKKESGTEI